VQIVFPIFDGITALDAIGPYEVLARLPGAEVVFAADEPGPKRSENGALALHADAALAQVPSPAIVVVPGHAFVGWETWDESGEWRYVETTMINKHTFAEASVSAAATATRYAGVDGGNTRRFRRWPLRQLRSSLRITPME